MKASVIRELLKHYMNCFIKELYGNFKKRQRSRIITSVIISGLNNEKKCLALSNKKIFKEAI